MKPTLIIIAASLASWYVTLAIIFGVIALVSSPAHAKPWGCALAHSCHHGR